MSIINNDTFEKRRKTLGLTKKEIANQAQIREATVGKIKKGKNLSESSVSKIAKFLGLTVEQISNPPDVDTERQRGSKIFNNEELTAASILYNVSESWIVDHAPLFFVILAEKMFAERKTNLEQWEKDFKALDNAIPFKDESSEDWKSFYLEGIEKERQAIEQNDLSGPRDASQNQNAKFINFLKKEAEPIINDFEVFDAFEYDPVSKKEIELGAELSSFNYYTALRLEVSDHLLSGLLASDLCSDQYVEVQSFLDRTYILSEIPRRLRTPDRAKELVDWVLQFQQNSHEELEKLLPESWDEETNQKRARIKSFLKDTKWGLIETINKLKDGPIDGFEDEFIQGNLGENWASEIEEFTKSENSDA
jgi:transcriptional regulator with XRE-family HTH domain